MKGQNLHEQLKFFYRTFQEIDGLYVSYAKDSGLSEVELYVLEYLCANDEPCTQKEIAEQLMVTKQAVNLAVRHFLSRDLVDLREIKEDRRNKTVRLTEAGRAFAKPIVEKMWDAEMTTIRQLSDEQREQVIEAARIYEKTLRDHLIK